MCSVNAASATGNHAGRSVSNEVWCIATRRKVELRENGGGDRNCAHSFRRAHQPELRVLPRQIFGTRESGENLAQGARRERDDRHSDGAGDCREQAERTCSHVRRRQRSHDDRWTRGNDEASEGETRRGRRDQSDLAEAAYLPRIERSVLERTSARDDDEDAGITTDGTMFEHGSEGRVRLAGAGGRWR